MTEVEVDRDRLCLELVVENIVEEVALIVDVHVVAVEGIYELWTGEKPCVHGEIASCHHALAQTECDVDIHRHGCLDGEVGSYLHGGMFL